MTGAPKDKFWVTRSTRLLKNESRSVSRSSLWFSVRSLCLCGECFCSHFHHRVTENHRDRTEKSLTQLEPMTFQQPARVFNFTGVRVPTLVGVMESVPG